VLILNYLKLPTNLRAMPES